MIKKVGSMKLNDAIKAVREGNITFATFNKFEIRKDDKTKEVRINQTSSNYKSFPVDVDFVCYLETFERPDLKPGYIVKTKDGGMYAVLDDSLISEEEYHDLDDYHDNLTNKYNTNADIIKVYKKKLVASLKDLLNNEEDCLQLITEITNQRTE